MSEVQIQAGRAVLPGNLNIPKDATALVLFAHGSGSSRHSPRNQFVARTLNEAGLATLLFDLLTQEEEAIDMQTRELSVQYPLAGGAPRSCDKVGKAARANEQFADRLFRLQHRRRGGAGGGGRCSAGRRRGGIARRAT